MARCIARSIVLCVFLFGTLPSASAHPISHVTSSRGRATRTLSRAVVDLEHAARRHARPAERETQEVEPAGFRSRPVPDWAKGMVTPQASAPAHAQTPSESPQPQAAQLATNFQGLLDNNTSIPPDTQGAVGLNHVMTTLNSEVRVQTRTGGVLSTVPLDSFWSGLGPFNTFDPKIVYDAYSGRWIFAVVADANAPTSAVLLAVSQTNDPTGQWNTFSFDADAVNTTWADYPTLGFNKDYIVINVNMFNIVGGNFAGGNTFLFSKADAYANVAPTAQTFFDAQDFTLHPATTFDNTTSTLYLLQDWDGNSYLNVKSITGAVGSATLNDLGFIHSSSPWTFGSANGGDFAPQLGSIHKIQNNDSRIMSVVYRSGSLWAAHNVFLPATATPTHTAVQWWQIDPVALSITQRARIEDPTAHLFYAFPSIAVNADNDVLIGYSRFSATQYPSADYSFRYAADPLNTLGPDTVLKAGLAPYYKVYSGAYNRWGDYSATVVDPTDDNTMWTLQEYSALPSGGYDRFGTWWGQVSPASTPSLTFSASMYSASENAGSKTITVTRGGETSGTLGVTYATSDGTANGSDYAPANGQLAFGPGVTTQTFSVPITNDTAIEPNETVHLTLSVPTGGASLGPISTATLTIVNDDKRQPDGMIKIAGQPSYIGNNIYNSTGVNQTKSATVARGGYRTFYALFYNDGTAPDSFAVKAPISSAGFTVRYYWVKGASALPISASAIAAGTYTLWSIPVNGWRLLRADVFAGATTARGARKVLFVTGTSKTLTSGRDTVAAVATVA